MNCYARGFRTRLPIYRGRDHPAIKRTPSIRKYSSAAGFRSIKNNIQATIYPGPKMLLILIPRPFTDLLQHNWSSPAILGE